MANRPLGPNPLGGQPPKPNPRIAGVHKKKKTIGQPRTAAEVTPANDVRQAPLGEGGQTFHSVDIGSGPQNTSTDYSQDNKYRLREALKAEGDTGKLYDSLKKGSKVTRVIPLDNDQVGVEVEILNREGFPEKRYADLNQDAFKHLEDLSTGGIDPAARQPTEKAGFLESMKRGYLWQGDRPPQQNSPFTDRNSSRYSSSLAVDIGTRRHPPKAFYSQVNPTAANLGRLAGDITGFGTQHYAWNMHPLDIISTVSYEKIKQAGGPAALGRATSWGAASILGAAGGNWNPSNLAEGGRQKGFQAISKDEEDSTKSTNPVLDTVLHRGIFGRTGYVLPWEEFRHERPDVSYEKYDNYKKYLRDGGILGLVKGTASGIDGPEARMMGYRVTPMGALAAGGTLAAGLHIAKRMAKNPRVAKVPRGLR